MIFRIFQFGTFFLIIWLTFQIGSLKASLLATDGHYKVLKTLNQELVTKQLETEQHVVNLDGSQNTILNKYTKDAQYKKQLVDYKKKQGRANLLQQAYILVLEAEAARAAGDAKKAISKLKSSKKPIWQSGDNYPKSKKKLQRLMQVIDAKLSAWKNKNLKQSTKDIYSVIATVLHSQGK